MTHSIFCRLAALGLLSGVSLALADHEDELVSVHEDNVTLADDLITIPTGTQDETGPCGQTDCPSIALSSASKATSGAVGALGARVDQARGSIKKQFSTITRLPSKGGAASADSSDIGSPFSPFMVLDTSDSDQRKTQRSQAYTQDSVIGLLGFDYRVTDTLILSMTASYLSADTVIANRGGESDSETAILGLHGSYYWGNTYLDALATGGQLDLDLIRNSTTGSYEGETEGSFHSGEVAVGHFFGWNQLTMTPSLRAFHIRGKLDEFEEQTRSGGGGALAYNEQYFEALNLRAALQLDYVFLTDYGTVTPSLFVAYFHEFTDAQSVSTRSGIKQLSDEPEQNYGSARFSLAFQFQRGQSAFISFEQLFDHYQLDQESLVAGFRTEF